MCQHTSFKRHGYDSYGKQRYRCHHCGRTWVHGKHPTIEKHYCMYRLSPLKEQMLKALMQAGFGQRKIRELIGVNPATIARRRGHSPVIKQPKGGGYGKCDFCGKKIKGEREFFRKTSRTKHKFCDQTCYQAFYRAKRAKDRCKRCGCARYSGKWNHQTFVLGMCQKCYALMRAFDFDEEAVSLHEVTQTLKQEINRGSQRQATKSP